MLAKPQLTSDQQAALDSLVALLPGELFPRIDMLEELSRSFRKRIAKELEPMLNDYLKTPGPEEQSLAERRETASVVNGVLDNLGLCVSVNGQPGLFVAELQDGRRPNSDRYAVLIPKGRGDRFTRALTGREIPPYLTLDAAPEGIDEILREVRRIVYHGRCY